MKSFFFKLKRIMAPLAIAFLAAGLLTIAGYLIFGRSTSGVNSAIFLLVLYFSLLLVGTMIVYLIADRYRFGSFLEKASDPTFALLHDIEMPVMFCAENGRILWTNDAFVKLNGNKNPSGQNTSLFFSVQPGMLCSRERFPKGTSVELNGRRFTVRCYELTMNDRKTYVTVWQDNSEYFTLQKKYSEDMPIFCYVVIDNLDEILRFAEGNYRTVASKIDEIMQSWAKEIGGVLREYDRDKYMILMNASALDRIVADQFDILKRIKDAWKDEINIPVTVSIGIGSVEGSLEERSAASTEALEIALQRGGDQAVIKMENGSEIYGGTTKGMQKKTKVRARVLASRLIEMINNAENVLIMGHRGADFDCFGACIGIAHFCVMCGKPFNIVGNLRNAGLKKCYEKADSIPYMTDDTFIDAAAAQDRLSTKTLLVICDVNNPKEFESPELAASATNIVCIDHHRRTGEFVVEPLLKYIDPTASSSCEQVADMLEQSISADADVEGSMGLCREEAELMLAGITLDTKKFEINTGTKTFGAAQYLISLGAQTSEVQRLNASTLDEYRKEAGFVANVSIYKGKYAISTNESDEEDPGLRIVTAKAADRLLSVEGVIASFAICRNGSVVHVSGRSNGKVNVQLIMERIGGGGRYDAAAARFEDGVVNNAYKKLIESIDEYEKILAKNPEEADS